MRNRAGWLALAVLIVATLLMVFFVLPQITDNEEAVTQAINDASETVKDAVTETTGKAARPEAAGDPESGERVQDVQSAAAQTSTPQTPAAKPSVSEQPNTEMDQAKGATDTSDAKVAASGNDVPAKPAPVTPAFDVLRVEPDGSTVIAGRAAPGSRIELTDGNKVIATVTAGDSGDFALVLDQPLTVGDHQLVLKATDNDGQVILSEETATVSVPTQTDGKLLAMVTKPGKASRLIKVPDAVAPATTPDAASTGPTDGSVALPELPDGAADLIATAPPIPDTGMTGAPAAIQTPQIKVTAVEIEGSRLFIAGSAPTGASLLGFADDQPVGRAKATGEGHFVIEGNIELAVGDHVIAVEMLDGSGKTALRVDVPFNRPAGEQVAAVAGLEGPVAISPIDEGAFDRLRNEAARAFALLKGLYEKNDLPTAEELAAARSATAIALKSLSEYRLPAGTNASARAMVDATAAQAAEARNALDKLPRDPKAAGSRLADITATIEQAVGPVMAESTKSAITDAADQEVADEGPKKIEQAPLTHSDTSVIIRRGDTLWQISRRVYGKGVRYTTIYLANKDQIENPDLIEPGQIFGVPDKALPNAEEFHRKRLQKQQR